MQLNWKPVISSFLRHMNKAGFTCSAVDNGDGKVKTPSIAKAIEEINATDEAHAFFSHKDETSPLWAYIVLGNEPEELISDYACRETDAGRYFDSEVQAWSVKWEGRRCPTVKEAEHIKPE